MIKVDNNPHLTTPTRHVMVGITRSKAIFIPKAFNTNKVPEKEAGAAFALA